MAMTTDDDDSAILQEIKDSLLANKSALVVFFVWLLGWKLSVELQFGKVYFAVSVIFGIFKYGLGKRKAGTLSAYSVFNPGFQEIEGTLNASSFGAEFGATTAQYENNNTNNNSLADEHEYDDDYIDKQEEFDIQQAIKLSLLENKKPKLRQGKKNRKKKS